MNLRLPCTTIVRTSFLLYVIHFCTGNGCSSFVHNVPNNPLRTHEVAKKKKTTIYLHKSVLLKGIIVAKRVKKFLAYYGTHKFIEPVVPVLSYLNSIHGLKLDSFKGRFTIYLFILSLPRYIFPQSRRLFLFPPIARQSIGIIIIIIIIIITTIKTSSFKHVA